MKAFKVWSRAATARGRYLSNFTHAHFETRMPDGVLMRFASIELAFHAHKFYYLLGGAQPALTGWFWEGLRALRRRDWAARLP